MGVEEGGARARVGATGAPTYLTGRSGTDLNCGPPSCGGTLTTF